MSVWKITPNLYQANLAGVYEASGVDLCVSCTYLSELTFVADRFNVHVHFPFDDKPSLPDMPMAYSIASLAVLCLARGETCLVNCNAGRNRSGLMLGLILHLQGFKDVVSIIQKVHPEALGNKTFADYLNSLK